MDETSSTDADIGQENARDARDVAFTAPAFGNGKRDWSRFSTPQTGAFGCEAGQARPYRRACHPPATGDGHT